MKPIQIYQFILCAAFSKARSKGLSEDKANRLANIYAVKNTWRVFNIKIPKQQETYISSMEFY